MKKLLRVAVVIGLVLCLSVSAFAAGSKTYTVDAPSAGTVGGEQVTVTVSAPSVKLTDEEAAKDLGVTKGNEVIVGQWELTAEIPEGGTLEVTFTVKEAGPKDKLYVFHYDGSKWEVVGEGTGNTVVGKFTSLSPVAIVVVPATSDESPKTGEGNMVLVAAAVMMMAGAVALTVYKKKA